MALREIHQTEGNPQAAAIAVVPRKHHNFQVLQEVQISKGGVMMKGRRITQLCAIAAFLVAAGPLHAQSQG
ncbi:MAG: hypothetical protein EBR85_08745, partial [Betaproteobacteria bacterium]|nr:hypothetical protein [Betaproteobacteria bacterium]